MPDSRYGGGTAGAQARRGGAPHPSVLQMQADARANAANPVPTPRTGIFGPIVPALGTKSGPSQPQQKQPTATRSTTPATSSSSSPTRSTTSTPSPTRGVPVAKKPTSKKTPTAKKPAPKKAPVAKKPAPVAKKPAPKPAPKKPTGKKK